MIKISSDALKFMWSVSETILKDGVVDGISMWRERHSYRRSCVGNCMFGGEPTLLQCAACIEGSLRTFNLYEQTPPEADCMLLKAAHVLKSWHQLHTSTITCVAA